MIARSLDDIIGKVAWREFYVAAGATAVLGGPVHPARRAII